MELFRQFDPTELIKRALAEDVGQGDITTAATVAPGAMGRARITVKEPRMILAGGVLIEPVMRQAGAEPRIVTLAPEGAELKAGDVVCIFKTAPVPLVLRPPSLAGESEHGNESAKNPRDVPDQISPPGSRRSSIARVSASPLPIRMLLPGLCATEAP